MRKTILELMLEELTEEMEKCDNFIPNQNCKNCDWSTKTNANGYHCELMEFINIIEWKLLNKK